MFGLTDGEFVILAFLALAYLMIKGAWGAWRMDLKDDEIRKLNEEKRVQEAMKDEAKATAQKYKFQSETFEKIADEWRTKYHALQSTIELKCPKKGGKK